MRIAYRIGVLSLLALSLLLSPASAAEKKDEKAKDLIVGKWAPTDDKAKDKVVLEFTKDGKIILTITDDGKKMEVKGTYKFTADDKMETEIEFMGEKKKETLTVTVTKDELTTIDEGKKKDIFKRVK